VRKGTNSLRQSANRDRGDKVETMGDGFDNGYDIVPKNQNVCAVVHSLDFSVKVSNAFMNFLTTRGGIPLRANRHKLFQFFQQQISPTDGSHLRGIKKPTGLSPKLMIDSIEI
jgi:hypothetical protein